MISLLLPKFPNAYHVRRSQVKLYEGPALDALDPLAASPTQNFRLAVTLSAGLCTGSVTVFGSLDGAAKSETLTFTGPRSRVTSILLDTLTQITTSGLADEDPVPSILVACIDHQGAPILAETLTPIILIMESHTSYFQGPGGAWTRSDARAFTMAVLKVGDIIRFDGTDHTIQKVSGRTLMGRSYRTLLF